MLHIVAKLNFFFTFYLSVICMGIFLLVQNSCVVQQMCSKFLLLTYAHTFVYTHYVYAHTTIKSNLKYRNNMWQKKTCMSIFFYDNKEQKKILATIVAYNLQKWLDCGQEMPQGLSTINANQTF